MIFVDANLFLRAMTRPTDEYNSYVHEIATEFLRQADIGAIEFTTSDAVLAEVAFILTAKKHYGLPVSTASGLPAAVVRIRSFRYRNKRTLTRALDIWSDHPQIGFVDALTAAYAQTSGMLLATFDSDFDAFPSIERWTPGDNH